MEQFDAYDYLKNKIEAVGLKDIRRCSGIINLEEILSSPGTIKSPVLIVEDNDSGFISLNEGNFDSGYYNIYIVASAKQGNAAEIHNARKNCKKIMTKLFLNMLDDAEYNDFGTGLDSTRIDYSKIGPLASGFYGYSAGFQFNVDFYYEEDAD